MREKISSFIPPKEAVALVLSLATSAQAETPVRPAQALITETGNAINEACQVIRSREGRIFIDAEVIPEFYRRLNTPNVATLSPRPAASPMLAEEHLHELLGVFGYDNFLNPVEKFQYELGLQTDSEVGQQTLNTAEQIHQGLVMCAIVADNIHQAIQALEGRDQTIRQLRAYLERWQLSAQELTRLLNSDGNTNENDNITARVLDLVEHLRAAKDELENMRLMLQFENSDQAITYLRHEVNSLLSIIDNLTNGINSSITTYSGQGEQEATY